MPVIPDNFFEMVGDSMLEVVSQQMRQENKTEAEIAFGNWTEKIIPCLGSIPRDINEPYSPRESEPWLNSNYTMGQFFLSKSLE